jgi:hypothetical protein
MTYNFTEAQGVDITNLVFENQDDAPQASNEVGTSSGSPSPKKKAQAARAARKGNISFMMS